MTTVQEMEKEILERAGLTVELAADLPLVTKTADGAKREWENGKPVPGVSGNVVLFGFFTTPGEESPYVAGEMLFYAVPTKSDEAYRRYTVHRAGIGFASEAMSQDRFIDALAGELHDLALEEGVLEECPKCEDTNPADAEVCGSCGAKLVEEEEQKTGETQPTPPVSSQTSPNGNS